ncbi:MAG: tRNA (adenine(22)-N(1))-methyltransferase TrmK [Polyangiaceae bacterium]
MTPRSAPQLKPRLEALLALLEPCRVLADVGTDHALLPAHAVLRGLAQRALAVDLRAAPLRAAARTLAALGVGERVSLIRGDGLLALVGLNVDVVVLAGLSGTTFVRWCAAAPEVVRGLQRLVVQPNGHTAGLRRHAHERGLHLLDENTRVEGGRHFISCAFGPGLGKPDPAYERIALSLDEAFELGPLLFARRDPLALDYYELQTRRLSGLGVRGRMAHTTSLAIFERGLAGL